MLGSGGGTALGIAVSHTAMDGEAVVKVRLPHKVILYLMKVGSTQICISILCVLYVVGWQLVEVWAKEARRLSALPEETGDRDGKSEDSRQALGVLNTCITDDLGKSDAPWH